MTIDTVKALSDKELNEKVAKLCGWEYFQDKQCWSLFDEIGHFMKGPEEMPDYVHDLNAMQDMRMKLSRHALHIFVNLLYRVAHYGESDLMDMIDTIAWANARERCEAFVLTMKEIEWEKIMI